MKYSHVLLHVPFNFEVALWKKRLLLKLPFAEMKTAILLKGNNGDEFIFAFWDLYQLKLIKHIGFELFVQDEMLRMHKLLDENMCLQ